MKSQPEVSAVVMIELTPLEGRQLVTYLDGLIEQAGTIPSLETLKAARDKLADANALALWLRENVALDLQPGEARAVRDALPAKPEQEHQPQEAAAALTVIRERLSACLSRRVASNA